MSCGVKILEAALLVGKVSLEAGSCRVALWLAGGGIIGEWCGAACSALVSNGRIDVCSDMHHHWEAHREFQQHG